MSLRVWTSALGVYALLAGLVTALGWITGLERLTDWEGSGITMKFNPALNAIAAGAAVLIATFGPRHRAALRLLGAVVGLVGGLTLLEHLLRVDLGIDTIFFSEPADARATAAPGRMGVPASSSFLLLGASLVCLTLGPAARRAAAVMGVGVLAIAGLSFIGHLFGADMLFTIPRLTGIAIQTATILLALGVATIACVPEYGLARALTRDDPGGRMLRRTLLPTIAVLLLIGWLRILGQHAGLYDTAFGSAASATAKIAVFTALLWWNAASLSTWASALRQSEDRYRAFIANSSEGVWRLEFDPPIDINASVEEQIEHAYRHGRLAECNEAMARMYGLNSCDELVGKTLDFMLPSADPAARAYLASIIRAGYRADQIESLERDAFGNPVHFSNNMVGVIEHDKLMRIWGTQTDITARKAAEAALRESESRLRLATQVGKIGLWEWNIAANTVSWTDSLYAIHGVTREQFSGTVEAFAELIHPDDRAAVSRLIEQSVRDGAPYEAMCRAVRPDGRTIWLFTNAITTFSNGRASRMHGATVDLTTFKRAEEASELLSTIVAASDDAIISMALDGTILSWNAGAERLFGYEASEIVGRTIEAIIPPEHRHEQAAVLEKLTHGERLSHYETVRVAKGGRRIDISVTVSAIRDSAGRIVGASKVARDITEQNRTREELRRHRERLQQLVDERTAALEETHHQLRQSERMAAIGTLSAGLGHDMGNLLVPLRVRLETLEGLELPEAAREELRGIRATAEYFRKLASGLRLLAVDPRSGGVSEPTLLPEWWTETEPVLRNVLPAGVTLHERLRDCGDAWVSMSKPALTQAVFNLIQNAGDAMRAAGSGTVAVSARREGDVVLLVVADNGPGMTDEVKRRCMEPFFTTKTRDVSTGLGLALVYGLTQEAGGKVRLETALGLGTTFTLALPSAAPPGAKSPGRRAFVEISDPRMRGYVASELKRMAYEVRFDPEGACAEDLIVIDEHARTAQRGRVVRLGDDPKISHVRETLRVAANDPGVRGKA